MKKNEIEVYDSRSLMIKIDPKDKVMETVPRESADIYKMCREYTRNWGELYKKYSKYDVNQDMNEMYIYHKIYMANNELKHLNDHCVYSTIELIRSILYDKEIYFDRNELEPFNRTQFSYLGVLDYKYDDVKQLYYLLSDKVEYVNDENHAKYVEFSLLSKLNMYSERVSTDLYNNLISLIYAFTFVLKDVDTNILKCVEDAVTEGILQFHDIYMHGLADLIVKFHEEYGFEIGKPLPQAEINFPLWQAI